MIRFRLRELMADLSFREGRQVTLTEIARETGIARRVLTSISNERGYNTGTDNLDRLCAYFSCSLANLAEHVPDAAAQTVQKKKNAKRST